MDSDRIVIAHPDLGDVRALVHPDSQDGWTAAGWQVLGPWCGVPDSLATADEHAAQTSEPTPTPTPRRRKAAEKSE